MDCCVDCINAWEIHIYMGGSRMAEVREAKKLIKNTGLQGEIVNWESRVGGLKVWTVV